MKLAPIASAFALHGYRQRDHDEGWALIRAIGYADVAGAPQRTSSLEHLLQQRTALASRSRALNGSGSSASRAG